MFIDNLKFRSKLQVQYYASVLFDFAFSRVPLKERKLANLVS